MAKRIRIAVVYGGQSSEHAVSVVSAASVLAALDPAKYEVVTVGISARGEWLATELNPAEIAFANRELPSVAGSGAEIAVFGRNSAIATLDTVDVVFPVLHGKNGEDGTIQGLLELAGVPYVGSGVLASAASMDKAFTKTVLTAAGLPVTPYVLARRDEPVSVVDVQHLGLPLFVKPARAGSSVGVSRVNGYDELPEALATAFDHDSKALIEAAMTGREIECGVLEDADGTVTASLPAEIRLRPGFDWYSFEAKYLDDASDYDIPPDVDPAVVASIRDAACRTFRALECSGLARVDGFLTGDGTFVVNEVNTLPGFTPISMYPKMWAETGVPYAQLLDRLIATALARSERG